MIHIKYVVFMSLWPTTTRISISNWPRTWKYGQARPYLTMVTRWSRFTCNFYTLIGQNLTGEFIRKNYAASWELFTLTAEVDRVLCQLVMFLTVFFFWMYKMKYSCYIKSLLLFMAGLFTGFLVEKCVAFFIFSNLNLVSEVNYSKSSNICLICSRSSL